MSPLLNHTSLTFAALLGLFACFPLQWGHGSVIDTLVEDVSGLGSGGIEEARASARAHAASSGEQLGHHSIGLEEVHFAGSYTPPMGQDHQEGSFVYGLALFSDDGCEVKVDGKTVHSRFRKGQALPRLHQSFYELPVELEPGRAVYIEMAYSNVHFITRGSFSDIDGATLFVYRKPKVLNLTVDADRNDRIDFSYDRTSEARPFRFWINNDGDVDEDTEKPEARKPDHADERIRTQRDLEDFARMKIMVAAYQEELREGEVQAVIRFDDDGLIGEPSIQVFPHLDAGGSSGYLTQEASAAEHIKRRPLGRVSKGQPLIVPVDYWEGKGQFRGIRPLGKEFPQRQFIFEGAGRGQGALVFELVKDGQTLAEAPPCWLKLMDVREMYQRAKVTPDQPDQIPEPTWVFGEEDNPLVEVPEPEMGWTWDPQGKEFQKDPVEQRDYLIFVHGWRMTYEGSQKYGETMFKRCWHAGFKGRFLFIRWPTYSEGTHRFTNGFLTYNLADYRAWKSGKSVADIVNSLPNSYNKNICAHSMGNIVVGSAIRYGLDVDNYALFNAAVPAMCYDDNPELHSVPGPFPDDDADPITKGMGFQSKLNIAGDAVFTNYYLSDDSALASWRINNKRFKPNRFVIDTRPTRLRFGINGYRYLPNELPGARLQFRGSLRPDRHLRSFHEAASLAVRSKTGAVGAEPKAGGRITEKIDMNEKYGFGNTHSAQWQWRSQKTIPFFAQVLKTFSLNPVLEP